MPQIPVIDSQGEGKVATGDLLEDLWFDFLNFHRDARVSQKGGDATKVRRYLRASVFSFVSYLSGLSNRWQADASGPLEVRLADLAKALGAPSPPLDELRYLTSLMVRCADPKPSDELDLASALSFDTAEAAELRVLTWLDEFCRAAKLDRYVDRRSLERSCSDALGIVTEETYRGYDAIADDPHAFQDDPGVWDDPTEERAIDRIEG